MSEVQEDGTEAHKGGSGGRGKAIWMVIALVAVLGVLYGAIALVFKPGGEQGLKPLAQGPMAKLQVSDNPQPAPAITAESPDGKPIRLSDLKGKVVVVNLWASWCAPCKTEMPALAKLKAAYQGKDLEVLPISLDKGAEDIAKAKTFIASNGPLGFYHGDYSLAFSINPPADGLPTTILYDRSGRERARLAGGADWSTPEAHKVIDRLLQSRD